MSKMQRTKGAMYEREICDRLTQAVGRKVQRHIGQARDGGNDISVGNFIFECKRRKSLKTIEGWIQQAEAAKKTSEETAVVVMRSDGGKSLVMLSLEDFLKHVDVDKMTWPQLAQKVLAERA